MHAVLSSSDAWRKFECYVRMIRIDHIKVTFKQKFKWERLCYAKVGEYSLLRSKSSECEASGKGQTRKKDSVLRVHYTTSRVVGGGITRKVGTNCVRPLILSIKEGLEKNWHREGRKKYTVGKILLAILWNVDYRRCKIRNKERISESGQCHLLCIFSSKSAVKEKWDLEAEVLISNLLSLLFLYWDAQSLPFQKHYNSS